MKLTRAEIDEMMRRADEMRCKLRRASRELEQFGNEVMQRRESTAAAVSAKMHAMQKRSHLGMAGHYAAMAEFLYRGYNVAVPAVDIGDDVYVVEDTEGTMWRLQIKTSDLLGPKTSYQLSRKQLRDAKPNELFFMFMRRADAG